MPVKAPSKLPAIDTLLKENIFVMDEKTAERQDIRPLRVAILNLMPNKEVTETQLLRLIGNTPLQVETVFLRTSTYESKNTAKSHLDSFYKTFDEVKKLNLKFDGLIITGAPVEQMDFAKVSYWDELSKILAWAAKNVYSSLYICWAAQAALYYHYGIDKKTMPQKIFGIFRHKVMEKNNPLVRGFNDSFLAPHSRYTEVDREKLVKCKEVDILADSDEGGLFLASSTDLRRVFVFGHGEYDVNSLHDEYVRDKAKGLGTAIPKNYYVDDKEGQLPPLVWRAHVSLLFSNWLNYCVYQQTPYDLAKI